MKNLLLIFVSALLITFSDGYAQQWTETASAPEGGGVTDLLLRESNGHLFAVTGSFNWPNGSEGGIRRSTDGGDTWTNLMDAYTGRAIIEGPDGELLASIWEYPSNEGLYRSTDNGDTWQQLMNVPSGNNIFSISVSPGTPNIIYAGTRTGVYRSMDNGSTWAYANNGIPGDSWVRGLDVDPNGVVAAGTTNGLYVSHDNGDNWDKVTGAIDNDTIVSVAFDLVPGSKDEEVNLYAGTSQGFMVVATAAILYATAVAIYNFGAGKEITRTRLLRATTALIPYFMVSLYAPLGGNFFMSIGNSGIWNPFLLGLPSQPLISIFTGAVVTLTTITLFVGMYQNQLNGAKVYRSTIDTSTGVGSPYALNEEPVLNQNVPNPFNSSTSIGYRLSTKEHVTLKIFDITGKELNTLVDEVVDKGKHTIALQRSGLRPGIYYYVLQAGNKVRSKKLVIR